MLEGVSCFALPAFLGMVEGTEWGGGLGLSFAVDGISGAGSWLGHRLWRLLSAAG